MRHCQSDPSLRDSRPLKANSCPQNHGGARVGAETEVDQGDSQSDRSVCAPAARFCTIPPAPRVKSNLISLMRITEVNRCAISRCPESGWRRSHPRQFRCLNIGRACGSPRQVSCMRCHRNPRRTGNSNRRCSSLRDQVPARPGTAGPRTRAQALPCSPCRKQRRCTPAGALRSLRSSSLPDGTSVGGSY